MSNLTPNSQNPANPTVPHGGVVGEMTLLVVDPAGTCQLVKTTQSKVALGADSGCVVRIEAAGIEPMHCVISRDAEKSVARRWANNTWLNNQAFDEVVVNIGDVVRVGDYQIRIEADERAAVAPQAIEPVEQAAPQQTQPAQPAAPTQQVIAPTAASQPVQPAASPVAATQQAAAPTPAPQQPVAPVQPTAPVQQPTPVQQQPAVQPVAQTTIAPAPAEQPVATADPFGHVPPQAGQFVAGVAAAAVTATAVAQPEASVEPEVAPQQPEPIQPVQPVANPTETTTQQVAAVPSQTVAQNTVPEHQAPVVPQVQQVPVEQPVPPVAPQPPQPIQQAPVAPVVPDPQVVQPVAVQAPVQADLSEPVPVEPQVQQPVVEQQQAAAVTPIQTAPVQPQAVEVPTQPNPVEAISTPVEPPVQVVAPQAADVPAVEPQLQQADIETPPVPAPAQLEQPVAVEPTAPVETEAEPVAAAPEPDPADEIERQMAELERQRAEIAAEQERIAEARAQLEQQAVSPPAVEETEPSEAELAETASSGEVGSGDAQLDQVYEEIQGIRSETDTAFEQLQIDSREVAEEENASEEDAYEEDSHEDVEEANEEDANYEADEEELGEANDADESAGDEYEDAEEDAVGEGHDEEFEVPSSPGALTAESTEQTTEPDEDDPFARLQTLANDIPPPPDFEEDPFDRLQRMSSEEAAESTENSAPAETTAAEDPFETLRDRGTDTSSSFDDDDDPFAALQRNLEQAAFEPEYGAEDSSPENSEPVAVEPPQSVEELIAPDTTADEDSQYESATMAALARMGQSLDLEDDPVPPTQNDPMAMGAPTMQNSPPQAEAEDDINDYMAQLLQRVGGGSAEPAAEAAPAASAPAAVGSTPSSPQAAAPAKPAEPKKPITKLTELPPVKRHAPENTMNLAAMRELANQTNRSAIQSHARKQRKEASSAKFMLSMALVIGSLIVLFIPFFPLLIRSVVGVLMLGIGVFSCLRAMKIDAVGKMQDMFRKN